MTKLSLEIRLQAMRESAAIGGSAKGQRKRRSREHYQRAQRASTESRNTKHGYKSIDEILILTKTEKNNSSQVEVWE